MYELYACYIGTVGKWCMNRMYGYMNLYVHGVCMGTWTVCTWCIYGYMKCMYMVYELYVHDICPVCTLCMDC